MPMGFTLVVGAESSPEREPPHLNTKDPPMGRWSDGYSSDGIGKKGTLTSNAPSGSGSTLTTSNPLKNT